MLWESRRAHVHPVLVLVVIMNRGGVEVGVGRRRLHLSLSLGQGLDKRGRVCVLMLLMLMIPREAGIDMCRVDAMIMLMKGCTVIRVHVRVHAVCIHISIPVTHLRLVVRSLCRCVELLFTHQRERLHD